MLKELWNITLQRLQPLLNEDAMIILRALDIAERPKKIVLLAPNNYTLESVKKNYWNLVSENLKALLEKENIKKDLSLEFEIPDIFSTLPSKEKKEEEHFVNNLRSDYNFYNFISGPSNEHAFAAAQAVAAQYSDLMNPLLIYGSTGLGKSHLMHAIGNEMIARGLKKVLYISSEDFVSNYVNALYGKGQENIQSLTKRLRSLDALLIDDVQFLADKQRSQIEFFNTFNSLYDGKRQIVLASDRYPREIQGLEERLKSRFGHGLTVSVEPPELETRLAILQQKANLIGFELPRDVIYYLAANIDSNVRELEGALRNLYSRCQYYKVPVSCELAKEIFKTIKVEVSEKKIVDIQYIQEIIAQEFNITIADLTKKGRGKANIVLARQIAMSLAKEISNLSYAQIGEAFSRDHSTVVHAYGSIRDRCLNDENFKIKYQNLKKLLDK